MKLKKGLICFLVLSMILFVLIGCDNNKLVFNKQNFIVPDWINSYSSIIDEYRRFSDCLLIEGLESVIDKNIFCSPDEMLEYNWQCMLIETNLWFNRKSTQTKDAFGYAIQDINSDGNNELILLLQDYTVLAVFSLSNGKPKLMDAYWPKHRCAILDTGELYTLSSGSTYDWYYSIQKISTNGNELLQKEKYGMMNSEEKPRYYKEIDGSSKIISEKEINEFHERYPVLSFETANEITRTSGIAFTSITASPIINNTEAPVISIKSNGETVDPYINCLWSSIWSEYGWLAADGMSISYQLHIIFNELPVIIYGDDFLIQQGEDISFKYLSIYSDNFQCLHHNVNLSYLSKLSEGAYYISIEVVEKGKYIEVEQQHELKGYECVFKLVVE